MVRVLGGALLLLLVLAASACSRLQARTQPQPPPLDVPSPPARVVVQVEAEEPAAKPATDAAPRQPARRPPPVARTDAPPAKPDPSKTAAPTRQEATVELPKPVVQPDAPKGAVLETGPPGSEAEVERTIKTQIAKAKQDLRRVRRASLNADGKTQFDTATRFVEQADQALTERNLAYAAKLADKAATLAAVLVGR
jgi:hypothetical protein